MNASDVIIAGGGLVGMACAIALAQQGLQVRLFESKSTILPAAVLGQQWDSRIYTISPGNGAWLKALGIWQKLDYARICAIDAMEIWGDEDEHGTAPLQFNAYDANAANLGWVLESDHLQRALWSRMQELGIEVLTGIHCSTLQLETNHAKLELADGRIFSAGLIVAADGANSWVRNTAGITVHAHDYGQKGVVANFAIELPHHNIARQWFRHDGVLAWLPLPNNHMSIVWSTVNEHAQHLMGLTPNELQQEIAKAGAHALGALQLVTSPAAFPLAMQMAASLIQPRLALIGDAAHQIHPLAGQGINLGFRDVIALTQVLSERRPYQGIDDMMLLRRYERARKSDMIAMRHLTHGLSELFTNQQPLVKKVRNWGLHLTNQQSLLKKQLVKRALT